MPGFQQSLLLVNLRVNQVLAGDSRQILLLNASSLSATGTAVLYGDYRAVAGNINQGGFVYRWSSAGGAAKVLFRGDFIPSLGADTVFDRAVRPPLINDSGALVMLASIAARHPSTGVLSNFRNALLYQITGSAPVQKILVTGENVPGSPAGFGNALAGSIHSLNFNQAGQIALCARISASGSSGYNIVYAGTAPDLAFVLKSGWVNIEGVGTKSLTFTAPSLDPNEGVDRVTGEAGSRLSEAGEIVLRGEYSGIGIHNFDNGIFKASLATQPEPAAQTITFGTLPDVLINSTATLAAAASSSLPVSYTVVTGPASIAGITLTAGASAGLVTIRATQTGNAAFLAAAPVEQSFRVVATSSALAMAAYLGNAGIPPAGRLGNLDPDLDGLVNLMEFALGGSPLLADAALLPTVQMLNGVLTLTYTQTQSAHVRYTVKASLDVNALWSADGVTQGSPGPGGLTSATFNIADLVRHFLRLEVELLP